MLAHFLGVYIGNLAYWHIGHKHFNVRKVLPLVVFGQRGLVFLYFRQSPRLPIMDMLPKIDAPKYCTICALTFEGQEAYEKHQSKLHRKGDIECEYCYKRFLRKAYLCNTH